MEVTRAGYLDMTRLARALAIELCEERIVFVLEGGYSATGLEEGTTAVLEGMLEVPAARPPATVEAHAGSTLRMLVDGVAQVHQGRLPDLGTP
jgi:acetoin utilization deacetylase AcuC-like enzyme